MPMKTIPWIFLMVLCIFSSRAIADEEVSALEDLASHLSIEAELTTSTISNVAACSIHVTTVYSGTRAILRTYNDRLDEFRLHLEPVVMDADIASTPTMELRQRLEHQAEGTYSPFSFSIPLNAHWVCYASKGKSFDKVVEELFPDPNDSNYILADWVQDVYKNSSMEMVNNRRSTLLSLSDYYEDVAPGVYELTVDLCLYSGSSFAVPSHEIRSDSLLLTVLPSKIP